MSFNKQGNCTKVRQSRRVNLSVTKVSEALLKIYAQRFPES